MSHIWLINFYASTPSTGLGGRHHYMARELASMGNKVTLVAARSHHLLRNGVDAKSLPNSETVDGYKFLRLDVPTYGHAHSKLRIIAWFVFALRLLGLRRHLKGEPDSILYSSPNLVGYLGAEHLARATGASFVFEERDLWPLTLIEIGGYSPKHPFIRFLQWIEDRAYKRADKTVSNIEGAVEHMVGRGMENDKFTWVSNGIALHEVEEPTPLPSETQSQIPQEGLRIAYTGTLGEANALDNLIEAAGMVRDLAEVSFVVVGEGRARMNLERRCRDLGLKNVHFLGAVSKDQVQSVLSSCDACYIGWLKSPLYRWGIAANKIPEYLYSGKPIIHAYSGGYDPVGKFSAGITVPAEDPSALADAIRQLHSMPIEERRKIGRNGHIAAKQKYDYAMLAKAYEQILAI